MTFLHRPAVQLVAMLLAVLAAHLLTARDSEPFFNNDETRHAMTGAFVRDALFDLPQSAADPKRYATRYYAQYPALGLLVWPPFFYAVEGLAMAAFGPSFLVGRLVVAAFAAWALVNTYRFARIVLPPPSEGERAGRPLPLLAAALVAFAPIVFMFSQRVMLEVPTFALVLAAVVRFEKHLADGRGRDAVLACLFAALAMLTRFDGLLLLPYFALRLLTAWRWKLLLNRWVIVGVLLAAALVVPYYWLTWREYGGAVTDAATQGTNATSTGFLHPANLPYYLLTLPERVGWPLTVAAAGGLVVTLVRYRRGSGPVFALLAATWLFFTPLAELEPRHAIYWIPAVAVLACNLVRFAFEKAGRSIGWCLVAALLVGGIVEAGRQPFRYVFGYEAAAKFVLDHRITDRPVVMDGELNGAFIFAVRRNDPARSLAVVRGDKLVYAMVSDPAHQYRQFAATEADVLALLERVDPEFVVVEDPPPTFHDVPGAALLRQSLAAHPELYEPLEPIPIRSNYDHFAGCALAIYRKRHRNPAATGPPPVEVIGLGRAVDGGR